ncbi:hypothetical protein ADN00_13670 [Ornatilinea apprima]|uniref:Glycosyltransferase RgtA/B/C/D-like domain-containing protein n=1 Tax=Ornatilinea apprima TaxID=1134406 RepID=A0A0P6X0I5_9CHLR|nr:hypothetical protein [Ornatilinea apprima]KPL74345.1 hypothetical protein ADN00_13670 [Ornatilinea apprima]
MSVKSSPQNNEQQVEGLMLVICLLLVWIISARAPLDTDMWWHLRAGESTLASGKPLLMDIFSFTRGGEGWMNHSWFSEVLMALAYRGLGYSGLAGWVALTACATMLMVWTRLEGPPLYRAVWLLAAAIFSSLAWAPRPQIMSLLFLAVLEELIETSRQGKPKWLWALPLLFAVWSNLHAGYSLGFILIAAILTGDGLDWLLTGKSLKPASALALWAGLAGLATLINPNGLNTWRVVFSTVDVQALQQFISEWASPDFHQLDQLLFLLFFLFCTVILVLCKERVSGADLAKFFAFSLLAFYARRNIAPFAVIAAPAAARALHRGLDGLIAPGSPLKRVSLAMRQWFQQANRPQHPFLLRARKWLNLGMAAVLGVVGLGKLYSVSHPVMMDRYLSESYPVKAVEWLRSQSDMGNLLNEYDWGGYLIWFARDVPVFIDGRTDLYGDKILGDWIRLVQGGEGADELLERYEIETLLLRPNRPLARLLVAEDWKTVYADDQAVILQREAKNQP